nr:retrovirus-related Pol polyprotein LINE-1 [Tanacetum cinerariifolium]
MKLWKRVFERRLRREIEVLENQFGFMPGRSTIKAIHIIRSLMEKYIERQKVLHLAFLDLEKAYDNALEDNGLRVSREKTEYLRCNFNRNKNDQNEEEEIRIGGHILKPKESFRYLGYVIHKSGMIGDDVTHRIQVGWLKWRAATGIMCDKK